MDAALWASELMQGVLPDALRKLLWQDVQPLAELIITVDGYDYGRLGRSRRGNHLQVTATVDASPQRVVEGLVCSRR